MPASEVTELDRIDPAPAIATLKSGLQLEVVRMRTRQFFRFLKVLTHGAAPMILQNLNPRAEDFAQRLGIAVIMAVPDAELEAVEFIQSMVRPAGMHEGPGRKLSKEQVAEDKAKWDQMSDELFNPRIEDTMEIIKVVLKQEIPEIAELGKVLAGMLEEITASLPSLNGAAPSA